MRYILLLLLSTSKLVTIANLLVEAATRRMLTTGNQLKAARMLAELDQLPLAQAARVSIGTIRNMEAQGSATLKSGLATIRAVQAVLEAAGVEFLNHGQPGVRLRPKATDHPKPFGPATEAVRDMDAAIDDDRLRRG